MKTSHTGIHDPAFVALNREGKIAKEQKAALISASASTHGGWLGLLIAFVGMGFVALNFGKSITRMGTTGEVLGFAIIVGILIVSYLLVHALFVALEHLRWLGVRAERREGKVEFREGRYLPEAGGKTLRSVFGDAFNLAPGPYVFYCAKHSKWILSMESAGSVARSVAPVDPAAAAITEMMGFTDARSPAPAVDLAEVQRALALTLGFRVDDLQLNRQGRISRHQRRMLYGEMRSGLTGTVIGAGFAGFMIVYGPFLHPEKPILPFIVAAGFGALALVMSFKNLAAGLADRVSGAVRSAEGKVSRYTQSTRSGRGSRTSYYFAVEGLSFSVSSVAYEALIEGLTYRVYYFPRTRLLMGIEPLKAS